MLSRGDQGFGLARPRVVHVLAEHAAHYQGVLETLGRDETGVRPFAFDERVGGNCSAVHEAVEIPEQALDGETVPYGETVEATKDGPDEIVGHRRHLDQVDAEFAHDDQVDERAADIYADQILEPVPSIVHAVLRFRRFRPECRHTNGTVSRLPMGHN